MSIHHQDPERSFADALLADRVGRHARITPEELELFGKQAANRFVSDKISLNESVAKLAAEHPDINAEQVRRICEFANTATYLRLHDIAKEKSASASAPHFPLADPARVMHDLSDGTRPTVVTRVDEEYSRPFASARTKTAGVETALEDLFGAGSPEEPPTREAAITNACAHREGLDALRTRLLEAAEQLEGVRKQASDEHYDTAKRHLLDGGSFADVMTAARSACEDYHKLAAAMRPVVERLLQEKVALAKDLKDGVSNLEKVAYRVINEQHPLVTSFAAALFASGELEKVAMQLEEIDRGIGALDTMIREAANGR